MQQLFRFGPEKIGSVSWGTMRTEDLVPAFLGVLKEIPPALRTPDVRQAIAEGDALLAAVDVLTHGDPESSESLELSDPFDAVDLLWSTNSVSDYLNETLFDLLDTVAPEGCTFGASEGDGADYGFWSHDCEECGWNPGEHSYPHGEQCTQCGCDRTQHDPETGMCENPGDGDEAVFTRCSES